MKALIFVYSDAQFRIDGVPSVKQFPFDTISFDKADEIAQAGDVRLARGIYGMATDNLKEQLSITPTSGEAGTDYDVVTLAEKDPWPDPGGMYDPTTMATMQTVMDRVKVKYDRVHVQFSELKDGQLTTFIDDGKGR